MAPGLLQLPARQALGVHLARAGAGADQRHAAVLRGVVQADPALLGVAAGRRLRRAARGGRGGEASTRHPRAAAREGRPARRSGSSARCALAGPVAGIPGRPRRRSGSMAGRLALITAHDETHHLRLLWPWMERPGPRLAKRQLPRARSPVGPVNIGRLLPHASHPVLRDSPASRAAPGHCVRNCSDGLTGARWYLIDGSHGISGPRSTRAVVGLQPTGAPAKGLPGVVRRAVWGPTGFGGLEDSPGWTNVRPGCRAGALQGAGDLHPSMLGRTWMVASW
jgi:hypothetical protein